MVLKVTMVETSATRFGLISGSKVILAFLPCYLVLTLAQQLLLAHVVDSQQLSNSDQDASLEGCNGQRHILHRSLETHSSHKHLVFCLKSFILFVFSFAFLSPSLSIKQLRIRLKWCSSHPSCLRICSSSHTESGRKRRLSKYCPVLGHRRPAGVWAHCSFIKMC